MRHLLILAVILVSSAAAFVELLAMALENAK